jgi:hypothetical protein
MSHINQKNLNFSGNSLENVKFFEKASHHFNKASILLKMSSKSYVNFEKESDFLLKSHTYNRKSHTYNQKPHTHDQKPPISENVFRKASKLFKMPHTIGTSLYFSF